MSEPSMVCLCFRGRDKADVVAHFEKAGVPLYEIPDPEPDMIVLKKYVFEDHPEGHLKFLLKQLGIWDYSWTGWRMEAWVENNGPVDPLWDVFVVEPGNTVSDKFAITVEAENSLDARKIAMERLKGQRITIVTRHK